MLSGDKTAAEVRGQQSTKPQLLSDWKANFSTNAGKMFQRDDRTSQEQVRVAQAGVCGGATDVGAGGGKESFDALVLSWEQKRKMALKLAATYSVSVVCSAGLPGQFVLVPGVAHEVSPASQSPPAVPRPPTSLATSHDMSGMAVSGSTYLDTINATSIPKNQ